jgi:hypothetical protein
LKWRKRDNEKLFVNHTQRGPRRSAHIFLPVFCVGRKSFGFSSLMKIILLFLFVLNKASAALCLGKCTQRLCLPIPLPLESIANDLVQFISVACSEIRPDHLAFIWSGRPSSLTPFDSGDEFAEWPTHLRHSTLETTKQRGELI